MTGSTRVSDAAGLQDAVARGVEHVFVEGAIAGMPMITLAPGQRLSERISVCEAIAAAAFCAQRIGGSPRRRSVLAGRRQVLDAEMRSARPATNRQPGAVQSG